MSINTTELRKSLSLERENSVLRMVLSSSELKFLLNGVKHQLEEEALSGMHPGQNTRNMVFSQLELA